MKAKKTLLIGWDAADWRMIRPLLDAGKMPNLKRLIDSGVWGNLRTLHPVLSPMLWTSIGTGKRPYKHGINGFSEPDPATGAVRPVTNLSRKTKALWNILNQSGKQSNVVGWWPSHPAEPINGVMVSNQFQKATPDPDNWKVDPHAVSPQRLLEPLSEMRLHPAWVDGQMLLPFVPRAAEIDQKEDPRLSSLAKILAEISTVHAAATALMQLEPWDFMAVYYDGIDHFGHAFMKYHPPQDPRVSDADFALYQHVMEGGYRFHDMMLGVLMELAGDEANIMLISDHGFHPDHLRPQTLPNAPAGPASEHRQYGIFVMAGPDVQTGGQQIYSGSLLDITPTLLHAFDLPVGRDMDGKVLTKAFRDARPVEYVESWDAIPGEDGTHPKDQQLDARDAKAALQQLVDLGYIDQPDENQDVAVAETVRELDYNLAQSYVDGKKFVEAHRIAVRLWNQWPEESRFGLLQLQCEMALKAHEDVKRTFDRLKVSVRRYAQEARQELARLEEEQKQKEGEQGGTLQRRRAPKIRRLLGRASVDEAGIKFYEARVRLTLGEDEAAREVLESLTETWPGRQQGLYRLLGQVCLRLNEPEKAMEWLDKALELDPDDAEAHLQASRAQYLLGEDYASATHALSSLQLNYHNPRAHYAYGAALVRLEHVQWAVEALEVAVQQARHYVEAHELLAAVYAEQLKMPVKAKAHRELAEEARQANAQRSEDLQAELPSAEMEHSQEALLNHPKCDVLTINYNTLMAEPEQTVERLVQFLELPPEKTRPMLEVLDPELYRSRFSDAGQ